MSGLPLRMLPRSLFSCSKVWRLAGPALVAAWMTAMPGAARADEAAKVEADAPLPDPDDIDWSVLADDSALLVSKPLAPGRKPVVITTDPWSWSRADKADGSAAVAIKQPVTPFWDARVGADVTVAAPVPTTSGEVLMQQIARDSQLGQSSGSAWAAMTAPGITTLWDKTAIEARTDPAQEQSRLGTALSKSMPLGVGHSSLTLQNAYNVTQQTLLPGVGAASRVREIDQSARLRIADTGTSLIAGQTHSSADDKWLRRIAAEQTIVGGITVTGAVSETAEGGANGSLTAGFRHRW
jgi:hypothetical protein